MIKALFLACALIGLGASAATVQAAPVPNVLCGPQCGSGDGRPPCQDWNLGSFWTANGHRWVCARNGSTDAWFPVF